MARSDTIIYSSKKEAKKRADDVRVNLYVKEGNPSVAILRYARKLLSDKLNDQVTWAALFSTACAHLIVKLREEALTRPLHETLGMTEEQIMKHILTETIELQPFESKAGHDRGDY